MSPFEYKNNRYDLKGIEKMKKIISGVLILFFMATACYAQESKQPLQLTIKSAEQVYAVGEEIKLELTINNNSDKEQIIFWGDELPEIVMPLVAANVGTLKQLLLIIPRTTEKSKPLYIKPKTSIKKNIVFKKDSFTGMASLTVRYEFKGELDFKTTSNQELVLGPIFSNTITIRKGKKENFYTSKEQEAELRWKNLVSYLLTEAKYWDTSNVIGKDVLFEGNIVAPKGNLIHIQSNGALQGPHGVDCFVEPPDNIDRYRKADSISVEVLGSIISINESHQIFVKAKEIVIKASQ